MFDINSVTTTATATTGGIDLQLLARLYLFLSLAGLALLWDAHHKARMEKEERTWQSPPNEDTDPGDEYQEGYHFPARTGFGDQGETGDGDNEEEEGVLTPDNLLHFPILQPRQALRLPLPEPQERNGLPYLPARVLSRRETYIEYVRHPQSRYFLGDYKRRALSHYDEYVSGTDRRQN